MAAAAPPRLQSEPPEPDLSHLTEDERRIIESVLLRQKREAEKDSHMIKNLEKDVKRLEDSIKKQIQTAGAAATDLASPVTSRLSASSESTGDTCRICNKVKFAGGAGYTCHYCQLKSCSRCGGKVNLKSKMIWACNLCRKKQELALKTGQWYHGARSGSRTPGTPSRSATSTPLSHQGGFLSRQSSVGSDTENHGARMSRADFNHRGATTRSSSAHALTETDKQFFRSSSNTNRDHQSHTGRLRGELETTQFLIPSTKLKAPSAPIASCPTSRQGSQDTEVSRDNNNNNTAQAGLHNNRQRVSPPFKERQTGPIPSSSESTARERTNSSSSRASRTGPQNDTSPNFLLQQKHVGEPKAPSRMQPKLPQQHPTAQTRPAPPPRRNVPAGSTPSNEHQMARTTNSNEYQSTGSTGQWSDSRDSVQSVLAAPRGTNTSIRREMLRHTTDKHSSPEGSPSNKSASHNTQLGVPTLQLPHNSDGPIDLKAAARNRRREMAMLHADSLSSDPSDCVRPPPPKPHKPRRESERSQRDPNRAGFSSSDEEMRSTTSCGDDLESESLVSEAPPPSHRGDNRNYLYDRNTPQADRPQSSSEQTQRSDEVIEAKIKNFLAHPVTWERSKDRRHIVGHMILNKMLTDANGQPIKDSGAILGLKVIGGKMTEEGRLGAFITGVKRGSIADTVGHLKPDDEVIEWNGRSLQGATVDEVYEVILESKQEPQVELIVQRKYHPDNIPPQMLRGSETTPTSQNDRSSMGEIPPRRLMSITRVTGKIQLKLRYMAEQQELIITVLSASELPLVEINQPPQPYCKIHFLPSEFGSSRHYEKQSTRPVSRTREPEWRQIFNFKPVDRQDLSSRSIDVTVWSLKKNGDSEFLGEIVIDLQTAKLNNEALWYRLRHHEETSTGTALRNRRPPSRDGRSELYTDTDDIPTVNSSLQSVKMLIDHHNRMDDQSSVRSQSSASHSSRYSVDYQRDTHGEGRHSRSHPRRPGHSHQSNSAGPSPTPRRRYSNVQSSPETGGNSSRAWGEVPHIQIDERMSTGTPCYYDDTELPETADIESRRFYPAKQRGSSDPRGAEYNGRGPRNRSSSHDRYYSPRSHPHNYGERPMTDDDMFLSDASEMSDYSFHSTQSERPHNSLHRQATNNQQRKLSEFTSRMERRGTPSRRQQSPSPMAQSSVDHRVSAGSLSDSGVMSRHRSTPPGYPVHSADERRGRASSLFKQASKDSTDGSIYSMSSDSSNARHQWKLNQGYDFPRDDHRRVLPGFNCNGLTGHEVRRPSNASTTFEEDMLLAQLSSDQMHSEQSNVQQSAMYDIRQQMPVNEMILALSRKNPPTSSSDSPAQSTSQSGQPKLAQNHIGMPSNGSANQLNPQAKSGVAGGPGATRKLGVASPWAQPGRNGGEGLNDFIEGLGPGQVVGRQVLGGSCLGEIQMGLSDKKGRLEVEVIRARGLVSTLPSKVLPAPYVKAYLMDSKTCAEKLKTRAARKTLDPFYNQILTFMEPYMQKVLQVMVWGDYGRLDKKAFMGVVQVNLDDLDLSNIVFGWYKLFTTASIVGHTHRRNSQSSLDSAYSGSR